MRCIRFTVSGIVQGVGFRYHTCHEGIKRNLTGYARNLSNGDVEVVASGENEQMVDFFEWLKAGPPSSRVKYVEAEDIEPPQSFKTFEIRY